MAKAREIKKRIQSVQNTKTITRTMEMVATARASVAQRKVEETKPYLRQLQDLLAEIRRAGGDVDHPLLRDPAETDRVAVLSIVGNRGLCGAYNHNMITRTEEAIAELEEEGRRVDLYATGRKGIAWYEKHDQPVHWSSTVFDHDPDYDAVVELADELMERFVAGEIREAKVVYGHYLSAGDQRPWVWTLLPPGELPESAKAGAGEPEEEPAEVEFIFEPDAHTILSETLPLGVRMSLYMCFLESATSEQIARRIAMKNATDNAEEMIDDLRRRYNRARQAQITSEIADIVGGAAAIS